MFRVKVVQVSTLYTQLSSGYAHLESRRSKAMKHKHLKKGVEKVLIFETILLMLFVCSINDFEIALSSFLIIFGSISIIGINFVILSKYGRLSFDDDYNYNLK